jgi:glycosyltransferase involved in cell wall biosynthesis
MAQKILIDGRWDGDTGIGRLYREVMQRTPEHIARQYVTSNMRLGHPLTPLMLSRAIIKSSADVFYSPSFMPPLYSGIPFVCTIHDLMHLYYYSSFHRWYYKYVIARLAGKAKKIITVSHYSKRQLVELLGIDDARIAVVYNGVDARFSLNNERAQLGAPYFLYVGNRRPYKNVPAMLQAFSSACIPDDFIFALSGEPDKDLGQLIRQLGIAHRVRFLGFIPEHDLPKYYKGAYATLFVSKMEGFGLPLLESMASGTPVLTSSVSSMPELAGGAALCVDPHSVEAIRVGMEKLVDDKQLYQQCAQRGLERALPFTWDTTAQQTWSVVLDAH